MKIGPKYKTNLSLLGPPLPLLKAIHLNIFDSVLKEVAKLKNGKILLNFHQPTHPSALMEYYEIIPIELKIWRYLSSSESH